jgi:hypothetical protein
MVNLRPGRRSDVQSLEQSRSGTCMSLENTDRWRSPGMEPLSKGHVLVRDWWGTEIIVNTEGPCDRRVFKGGS